MRLALVMILVLLPVGSAVTWDDPAADQQLGYAAHMEDGEPEYQWTDAGEQGWYGNVDLLSATIDETPTELIFTIKTSAAEADGPPAAPGGPSFDEYVYGFTFDFEGRETTIALFPDFFDGGPIIAEARPWSVFGRQVYFPAGFSQEATPLEGGGWTGRIDKSQLRTEDLVPLREGHVLKDIRFFAQDNDLFSSNPTPPCANVGQDPAQSGFGAGCSWTVMDTGEGGQYEVVTTPPGIGHIFLRMPEPFRFSNGLATTYLFEADLRNLEPLEDTVVLQVSDVPSGWEVRLPPAIDFSGEGQTTVPIAVTVPFSHQHGVDHIMQLSAVSQHNTSAIVEASFGVFFADPPQPAGHHDTLRFFGESYCPPDFGITCDRAYMHAGTEPNENRFSDSRPVDEVTGDAPFHDPSDPASASAPATRSWWIDMDPSLRIGLDFDVSEKGLLRADLRFAQDWEADVEAELVMFSYRDDGFEMRRLGHGVIQQSFAADQAQAIEIPISIEASADLVPYEMGQNLVLFVNATDTSGLPYYTKGGDAHLLVSDASLRLPLLDYHEEVDLTGLDFADLTIERLNATHRFVNPGKTTVFGFRIGNAGEQDVTVDWSLDGDDNALTWASLTPTSSRVPAGGNATVVVRVQPPPSAVEGDVAELLLIGTERGTANPLYGRMTASVIEGDEIPDEAENAQDLEKEAGETADGKDSPAGLWIATIALAAALVLRRR